MITKLLLNRIESLKKNIVALKEVNAVLKRRSATKNIRLANRKPKSYRVKY